MLKQLQIVQNRLQKGVVEPFGGPCYFGSTLRLPLQTLVQPYG